MGSFIDSKAKGWFGFISVTPFMRSSCILVSVSACAVPAGKTLRGGYQAVSYADIQHAYVHIRICCPTTGQMCCRPPWRSGSFTSLPTSDVVDFISSIWGLNSSIPCGLNLMTHHVDCFPTQILHLGKFLSWQRYSSALVNVCLYLFFHYCFSPKSVFNPELQISCSTQPLYMFLLDCIEWGSNQCLMNAKQEFCPEFYSLLSHLQLNFLVVFFSEQKLFL